MKDLDIYGDKAVRIKSFALKCFVAGFFLGSILMMYFIMIFHR
jgi:hypothetical protein